MERQHTSGDILAQAERERIRFISAALGSAIKNFPNSTYRPIWENKLQHVVARSEELTASDQPQIDL